MCLNRKAIYSKMDKFEIFLTLTAPEIQKSLEEKGRKTEWLVDGFPLANFNIPE
jgi:hypothetical protein